MGETYIIFSSVDLQMQMQHNQEAAAPTSHLDSPSNGTQLEPAASQPGDDTDTDGGIPDGQPLDIGVTFHMSLDLHELYQSVWPSLSYGATAWVITNYGAVG